MIINILEYLETTAQTSAHKQAVIDGERTINFEKLLSSSKSFASFIIATKNFFNRPIGVFLPKSIESVISDIAITYTGNIYMNLDIRYPENRLKNVLNRIQPEIIITNTQLFSHLEKVCSKNILIINIDEYSFDPEYNAVELVKRLGNIIDTDPYCIINTSGSTGTPKGVVLNHRSFIEFTEWSISALSISDNAVIGSLSPLYFDIYSYELCLLMSKAATIVIIPEQLATFPVKIIEFLSKHDINFIFWVPTIMVNIANLDILSNFSLDSLKHILFAGEVFPTKHLNYWRQKVASATFINLYGPIEITLDCTYYIVNKEFPNDTPIPIGYPCRNTDILILNEENQRANVNEKGELCVRGTSLAMGYYNDPEKTGKAFVQNPLNQCYPELIYRTGDVVYKNDEGEIMFVGRKDYQVKHLGYRIDLSEIEHVIVNSWGKIKNACVIYNSVKKEITLFYEGLEEISLPEFRKEILQFLPKYMVPTQFRIFQELPRNPNGKIDRNYLSNLINDDIS